MNESEFVLGGDELRNIKIKETHKQPFKKAPIDRASPTLSTPTYTLK